MSDDNEDQEDEKEYRNLVLHGSITLRVPNTVGDYAAWQQLEELLDGGPASECADLGNGVFVTDYFAGRITGPPYNHGRGTTSGTDQKTSHYKEWVNKVVEE